MVQTNSDTDQPEKELVQKILSGDNHAFRMLIQNNQRLVFSITARMLNNQSDMEDICQDIFMKAFANISGFRFDSRLSTWIARIAYTTCINHIKKKRPGFLDEQVTADNENNDLEPAANQLPDEISSAPDEILFNKELKSRLNAAINKLPAVMRTAIFLYHQEEMSYMEIASVMGLPAGTVKSHLFRARSLLKTRLLQTIKKGDVL